MNKKMLLDKLLLNCNRLEQKKIQSDQNFWKLFLEHQRIIERETLECLLILNRTYEDMFNLARNGEFQKAIIQLKDAHALKNKFEFDENEDAIFKIITYPNIAYLKYKLKNIRSAQYYTKRTINLIKNKQYQDPIFLFRIIQQEINYITLFFESNLIEKGINHLLKSIIECYGIISNCMKNKNYYDNHQEDILLLHYTNVTVLTAKLCNEIKKNEDKFLGSNVIKWSLVALVANLISI